MKLSRRLIPAIAMLMVSAVLMSTASFAWFSMNNSVTATGLTVTASAPTSLMISVTNATTGFSSVVSLSNDNPDVSNVLPVTPYKQDGSTLNVVSGAQKFFKLTPEAAATVNESGAVSSEIAAAPVEAGTYYTDATTSDVFADKLWIKLEGAGTANENVQKQLQVAATWVQEPSESIKTAIHILFTDKDGNKLLDMDMSNPAAANLCKIQSAAAEGTQINVYAYIYGNDSECRNANISTAIAANITLTFTYTEVTQ